MNTLLLQGNLGGLAALAFMMLAMIIIGLLSIILAIIHLVITSKKGKAHIGLKVVSMILSGFAACAGIFGILSGGTSKFILIGLALLVPMTLNIIALYLEMKNNRINR